jgi:ribonuclease HI
MPAPAQAKDTYLAWFDGACKPVNPGGTASFGVVIKSGDGPVLLRDHGVVGSGKAMSNNVAEYAGAHRILEYLSTCPPEKAVIRGDAQLIVNQLEGKWRIKKGMYLPIAIETKELLAHLRGLGWQINLCWVPREQNEECDALSKKIGKTPDSIQRFNDRQDCQDHQITVPGKDSSQGWPPINPSLPGRSVS